ncbi:hypothetical protein RGU12_10820 [Fredinandcohnia sp. QZ13]|nr:hypothetical protein [Fredinandcohnia sp. QZ13]MDR4888040.1 hypothetical protein [Fredinandcohnia sp. QZ13]
MELVIIERMKTKKRQQIHGTGYHRADEDKKEAAGSWNWLS